MAVDLSPHLDGGKEARTGRKLLEEGFTVMLGEKPSAAVIAYRKVMDAEKSN